MTTPSVIAAIARRPSRAAGQVGSTPPTVEIVSIYRLNGGVATDHVNAVDGTVLGDWDLTDVASMVSGIGGTAMFKNGGSPHITLPANNAFHDLNALTLSLYYQPQFSTVKHTLFACGNGTQVGDLSIERLTNGQLNAYHVGQGGGLRRFGGAVGIAGTNLVAGTAYRVTMTLGPTGAKIYLGNTLLANIAENINGWNNTAVKYVGIWVDATQSPAEGTFDHIRLWNGELTASGVAALEAAVSVVVNVPVPEPDPEPDPEPTGSTPAAPIAPQSYTIPAGATSVTNGATLQTQLSSTSAKNIVLENGTYDKASNFTVGAAHRLWARTLGGATLTAAILFNNGAGPEVHGCRFNISSSAKRTDTRRSGACLSFQGNAHRCRITDCWFDGHFVVGNAVDIFAFNDARVQRCVINEFMNNGVIIHNHTQTKNGTSANPRATITDLNITNIVNPGGSQNGSAEFGVNAGTDGLYQRIKTRNTKWSGISPGVHCFDSEFLDIDIDITSSAGFYWEHFMGGVILMKRFSIGPAVAVGMNFESAQDRWGCRPVEGIITVEDGTIRTTSGLGKLGINVPYCTSNVTLRRIKFIGQCRCAIAHSAANTSPEGCCGPTGHTNTFVNNDYSQLGPNATPILNAHPNGIAAC